MKVRARLSVRSIGPRRLFFPACEQGLWKSNLTGRGKETITNRSDRVYYGRMLEEYSAAYYIDRVLVEPGDGVRAVLERGQFQQAVATVYAPLDSITWIDVPLVVKLGRRHLPVFGSAAVPSGTLTVPAVVLDSTRFENPPTLTEILVAKAERAARLLEWFAPPSRYDPVTA